MKEKETAPPATTNMQGQSGPPEIKGAIGAPFKAPNYRMDDAPELPKKDLSGYGAPFKAKQGSDKEPSDGIPCPKCKSRHNAEVTDTRPKGDKINRKRKCRNCGNIFSTKEELPFKSEKDTV